jgi:hypothetical protein
VKAIVIKVRPNANATPSSNADLGHYRLLAAVVRYAGLRWPLFPLHPVWQTPVAGLSGAISHKLVSGSLPRCGQLAPVNECNRDVSPVPLTSGHWRAFLGL